MIENVFENREKISFSLRELYSLFGYSRYKMGKFEEYDLYVKNKDFLISDSIITFTDTNGRLMALKPDVTLSIIKNAGASGNKIEKYYYDENVYRISESSHQFREIGQTGLECIGDVGIYEICEVISLALKSLLKIDECFILDLSHVDLLTSLLDDAGFSLGERERFLSLLNSKSFSLIEKFEETLDENKKKTVELLKCKYSSIFDFKNKAEELIKSEKSKLAFEEFNTLCEKLSYLGLMKNVSIDFSIVNDFSYYSGVVFKGYIKGIPSAVLSGGQYDKLMRKMKKPFRALGFAVYLDLLDRFKENTSEYDCDCLVLKNEKTDPAVILKTVDILTSENKIVFVSEDKDSFRSKEIIDLREEI